MPPEYEGRADEYVELVCGDMLAACAPHARWIDAFCERGAFDADQCREVLTAGRAAGLGLRLHANQLGPGPGVQLAVELGCASADHCTYLSAADVDALAGGQTVATFLPATDFSTRQPYPDARRVIDAGATVALATNCNPGSSYTTSMAFVIALAVRDLGMTATEALTAATLGGARALHRDDVGWLGAGSRADLVILDAPSYTHLVYRPGVPLIHRTLVGGAASEVSVTEGLRTLRFDPAAETSDGQSSARRGLGNASPNTATAWRSGHEITALPALGLGHRVGRLRLRLGELAPEALVLGLQLHHLADPLQVHAAGRRARRSGAGSRCRRRCSAGCRPASAPA